MTDRELLEWALAALDGYARNCGGGTCDAAEALRVRLARPEEPDWSAAGFSKPPQDRQCPSCGGFCKKGCERENVQPDQHSEQWWRHEVSNAFAQGYEKGRASVKQPEPMAWADKYDIERKGHDFWVSRQQPAKNGVPLYTTSINCICNKGENA